MSDINTTRDYASFEYKEIIASRDKLSFFLDSYECFGWFIDDKNQPRYSGGKVHIYLKRDRKIANKAEITRLCRHFEVCVEEMRYLERSKKTSASVWGYIIGIIGCAFMAGATFAATSYVPNIPLTVVLAIPGFILWGIPYPIYRVIKNKRTQKNDRLIEKKLDEICTLCEKGEVLIK